MAPKSNKLKEKKTVKATPSKDTTVKKGSSAKKKKINTGSKTSFLRDPRFLRSVGIVFLIIGIYLFLAITTYIVNWFSADIGNHATTIAEYKDHTETVSNWTGWLGSYLASFIVYKGIGLGSILISIIFTALGLRLLINVKMFGLWRWFELLIKDGLNDLNTLCFSVLCFFYTLSQNT